MIDILLKGETQNKGENIDYSPLIERMKEMKGELKQVSHSNPVVLEYHPTR